MEIKQGIVPVFSESIEQELRTLNGEMRIMSILRTLSSGSAPSEADKADIRHLMLVLADLFSTSLPPVEDDPMQMLQFAARDLKLATLLKERGLARIYRMTTLQTQAWDEVTNQKVLLPAFMLETNPETGQTFHSQEELIGWFCREARVPRSLVFMRLRTYDRLLTVGMDLEEAFETVVRKPYATREALNEVAEWHKGELVGVNPDTARRLAQAMLPDEAEEISALVEEIAAARDLKDQDEKRAELLERIKPALRNLAHEVAEHQSMSDVMDMVRHDLSGRPEIRYSLDDRGWVKVEYLRKSRDINGTQYVSDVSAFFLVPEVDLPREVIEDMADKLHFRNRDL